MMVRHAEARRREAALNATNFLREEFPEATPATLALALKEHDDDVALAKDALKEFFASERAGRDGRSRKRNRREKRERGDGEDDSDSEDEEDETLMERVQVNGKVLYDKAADWGSWGLRKSKSVTFEFFAHTFFVTLPFAITIIQQQLDEQKWDHCKKVARQEIESDTMKSMGSGGSMPVLPPMRK